MYQWNKTIISINLLIYGLLHEHSTNLITGQVMHGRWITGKPKLCFRKAGADKRVVSENATWAFRAFDCPLRN